MSNHDQPSPTDDRPERWNGWYFKESRNAFIIFRNAIILAGLFQALEPLWREVIAAVVEAFR